MDLTIRTFAMMAMLTSVGLCDVPVGAQDDAGKGSNEHSSTKVDPYDAALERINRDGVNGVRAIWEQLGIGSSLFDDLPDGASIDVTRSTVELDGDNGSEVILQLSGPSDEQVQLLIIESSEDALVAVGSIELFNQRAFTPSYRVETDSMSNRWLVVQSLGGSGNGFERTDETWYAVKDGTLSQVLQYQVGGHVNGHGMAFDRSFTGAFVSTSLVDGKPSIEVEFTASYANGELFEIENLDTLFTRSGSVHYLESDDGSFAVDEDRSMFTRVELLGFFGDDEQGFLQHNFEQLKDMATNGSEAQRTWLRRFLELCDESSEKTVLHDMLDPDQRTGETGTASEELQSD